MKGARPTCGPTTPPRRSPPSPADPEAAFLGRRHQPGRPPQARRRRPRRAGRRQPACRWTRSRSSTDGGLRDRRQRAQQRPGRAPGRPQPATRSSPGRCSPAPRARSATRPPPAATCCSAPAASTSRTSPRRATSASPAAAARRIEGYGRYNAILGAAPSLRRHPPLRPGGRAGRARRHGRRARRRTASGASRSTELHRLPGDRPDHDTTLAHGELVTAVELPRLRRAAPLDLPQGARPGVVRLRAGLGRRRPRPRRRPRARRPARLGRGGAQALAGHAGPRSCCAGGRSTEEAVRPPPTPSWPRRDHRTTTPTRCRWCATRRPWRSLTGLARGRPRDDRAADPTHRRPRRSAPALPRVDGAASKVTGTATYAVRARRRRRPTADPLHAVAGAVDDRPRPGHRDRTPTRGPGPPRRRRGARPHQRARGSPTPTTASWRSCRTTGSASAARSSPSCWPRRRRPRARARPLVEVTLRRGAARRRAARGQRRRYAPDRSTRRTPPTPTRATSTPRWRGAEVVVEQTYPTPYEHNNPMEPHATIALLGRATAARLTLVRLHPGRARGRADAGPAVRPGAGAGAGAWRRTSAVGSAARALPHAPEMAAVLAAQRRPGRPVQAGGDPAADVRADRLPHRHRLRTSGSAPTRDGRCSAIEPPGARADLARSRSSPSRRRSPTRMMYAGAEPPHQPPAGAARRRGAVVDARARGDAGDVRPRGRDGRARRGAAASTRSSCASATSPTSTPSPASPSTTAGWWTACTAAPSDSAGPPGPPSRAATARRRLVGRHRRRVGDLPGVRDAGQQRSGRSSEGGRYAVRDRRASTSAPAPGPCSPRSPPTRSGSTCRRSTSSIADTDLPAGLGGRRLLRHQLVGAPSSRPPSCSAPTTASDPTLALETTAAAADDRRAPRTTPCTPSARCSPRPGCTGGPARSGSPGCSGSTPSGGWSTR